MAAIRRFRNQLTIFILIFSIFCTPLFSKLYKFNEDDLKKYRNRVIQMFQHGYESYVQNAYPYDELRPLSCDGVDTWGSFSLSLLDALDTLLVMGNSSEFVSVTQSILNSADFNININVSVFETNIRVVGGLLSAHLISYRTGEALEPGWPCNGPLLRLAEDVGRRLLPAFDTPTGMPYGTVNLRYGIPTGETPVTCTAGVTTFIVEFGTLSRLTGDPVFEETALKALRAIWQRKSTLGLVGNHINVQDGKWTALDSGIGAGVDSYFEYLVKGAALLQRPELINMFNEFKERIQRYMNQDDWFMWVSMTSGQVSMPIFQSLEAFWPGLLTLVGDLTQAQATLYNYHQVWRQYGFTPEFYDILRGTANSKREGYPLRPEFVESLHYLYSATKDPALLQMGVDVLEAIEHSARTDCGYATVKNVVEHKLEDRMESFFLAETVKYLYLLFDQDNFLHNNGCCGDWVKTPGYPGCVLGSGGYIFNTEAHPIDVAALACCSSMHNNNNIMSGDLDLFALLNAEPAPRLLPSEVWETDDESTTEETTTIPVTNVTLMPSLGVSNESFWGTVNESQQQVIEEESVIEEETKEKTIRTESDEEGGCYKGPPFRGPGWKGHEVLSCPAQPYVLRLFLMGQVKLDESK